MRFVGITVIAVTLATCGCRRAEPSLFPPRAGDAYAEAIVLDNHWHTALIFRTDDLPPALRADLGPFAAGRYVSIGWGDAGFFRAERITFPLIAQALFYSRGSVLLVVGFDAEPEATFDPGVDIYRVPTRPESMGRIVEAAAAAFRRKGGHAVDAGPGIDGGRFFTARGRYAFFHTCNQWVADALAAGGLPVTAAYAATAGNLAFQLRRLPGVLTNGLPLPPSKPAARPLLGRAS